MNMQFETAPGDSRVPTQADLNAAPDQEVMYMRVMYRNSKYVSGVWYRETMDG